LAFGECFPIFLDDDGSNEDVEVVAFSYDGSLLATAGAKGAVHIWDVKLALRYCQPATPQHVGVTSAAFNSNGSVFATGTQQGSVTLWSVARVRQVASLDREEPQDTPAGPATDVGTPAHHDRVTRLSIQELLGPDSLPRKVAVGSHKKLPALRIAFQLGDGSSWTWEPPGCPERGETETAEDEAEACSGTAIDGTAGLEVVSALVTQTRLCQLWSDGVLTLHPRGRDVHCPLFFSHPPQTVSAQIISAHFEPTKSLLLLADANGIALFHLTTITACLKQGLKPTFL